MVTYLGLIWFWNQFPRNKMTTQLKIKYITIRTIIPWWTRWSVQCKKLICCFLFRSCCSLTLTLFYFVNWDGVRLQSAEVEPSMVSHQTSAVGLIMSLEQNNEAEWGQWSHGVKQEGEVTIWEACGSRCCIFMHVSNRFPDKYHPMKTQNTFQGKKVKLTRSVASVFFLVGGWSEMEDGPWRPPRSD